MTSPDEIEKGVEKGVTWINWFAKQWKASDWVKRFTLLTALWLVFANPPGVIAGIKLAFPFELSDSAGWVWWVGYGATALGLIGGAFVAALRAARRDEAAKKPRPAPVLKWLNSYGPEDADLFRKLQRDRILEACLVFVRSDRLRFGILSGESGCGKTSFLQAGLGPTLSDAGHFCLHVKLTGQPRRSATLPAGLMRCGRWPGSGPRPTPRLPLTWPQSSPTSLRGGMPSSASQSSGDGSDLAQAERLIQQGVDDLSNVSTFRDKSLLFW